MKIMYKHGFEKRHLEEHPVLKRHKDKAISLLQWEWTFLVSSVKQRRLNLKQHSRRTTSKRIFSIL